MLQRRLDETTELKKDSAYSRKLIRELEEALRANTTVDMDVNYDGHNTVVVIGKFKNNNYINMYAVYDEDFSSVVNRLNELRNRGNVRVIDCPPSVRHVFRGH